MVLQSLLQSFLIMRDRIDIVIADSQPIFRTGLRLVLEEVDGFHIVGAAADGETAIEMITEVCPAVTILAADLPKKDGFEVARTILADSPHVRVVIMSDHISESDLDSASDLGIKGLLSRDSPASKLIEAVKAVSGGGSFVSPVLSNSHKI